MFLACELAPLSAVVVFLEAPPVCMLVGVRADVVVVPSAGTMLVPLSVDMLFVRFSAGILMEGVTDAAKLSAVFSKIGDN